MAIDGATITFGSVSIEDGICNHGRRKVTAYSTTTRAGIVGQEFTASDLNSDGILNVLDIVQLVNIILYGIFGT